MVIEIFTLCDFAKMYGGRLMLSGPFDVIAGTNVPLTHLSCTIAMRIRFLISEVGKHEFKLLFIDIDGNVVSSQYNGTMNININQGETSRAMDIALTIPHLKFEKFGEYSLRLVMDGREERSLPIFVKQLKLPASPEAKDDDSDEKA